jgi:hypothetical protein
MLHELHVHVKYVEILKLCAPSSYETWEVKDVDYSKKILIQVQRYYSV